jgi:chromatin remodeling complex protein RSC6
MQKFFILNTTTPEFIDCDMSVKYTMEELLDLLLEKGIIKVDKTTNDSPNLIQGTLSDELYDFLGVTASTSIDITEIIKKIQDYIIENNLEDSVNKRIIHPDETLKKLLKYDETNGELTYFNLKYYVSDLLSSGNTGFVLPTLLSDELCDFLGVRHNTLMARTDVTKHITRYIHDNNLVDDDGRHINADDKLANLLNCDDKKLLSFFNIQKYLCKHFPKE